MKETLSSIVIKYLKIIDQIPLRLGYLLTYWLGIFAIFSTISLTSLTSDMKYSSHTPCLEYDYAALGSLCVEYGPTKYIPISQAIQNNLEWSGIIALAIIVMTYILRLYFEFKEAKDANFYYSSTKVQRLMEILRLKEKDQTRSIDWGQQLVDSLNRSALKNKESSFSKSPETPVKKN